MPISQSTTSSSITSKSSNLNWSWTSSASTNWLRHSLKGCMTMVSQCFPKLAQSWPPNASLGLHHIVPQQHSWFHLISCLKCIATLARSQWYAPTQLKASESIINNLRHLSRLPNRFCEIVLIRLKNVRCYPAESTHTNCTNPWRLSKSVRVTTQTVWINKGSSRMCRNKSWEKQSLYFG